MPSIEIVCVGQKKPQRFRGIPFAIASEGGVIRSHHHPSRFQRDFDKLVGCIYHLGCPHFLGTGARVFEVYDLLSMRCRNQWPKLIFLEFEHMYVPSIKKIMITLLKQSPIDIVVFTSNYRFGQNKTKRNEKISLTEFWSLHQSKRLRFNELYNLTKGIR